MNTKIGLLALICFAYFFNLSSTLGQTSLNYEVSELPKKTKTVYDDLGHAFADEDHIYLFLGQAMFRNGKIELYRLNKDLSPDNEASLKLRAGGSKLVYSSSFIIEDNIFILCFEPIKGKKLDVYCQLIDKSSLRLKGDPVKVGSTTYETSSTVYPECLFMLKSDDESNLLIGYSNIDTDEETELIELHCFDKNLEEVYSKSLDVRYSVDSISKPIYLLPNEVELSTTISTYPKHLDNQGNFTIGILGAEGVRIFEVARESNEWSAYPPTIEGKSPKSLFFESTDDPDELIVSGTYSMSNAYGNRGIFRATIDRKSKRVIQSDFSDLSVIETHKYLGASPEEELTPEAVLGDPNGKYQVAWKGVEYYEDGGGIFYGEKKHHYLKIIETTKPDNSSGMPEPHGSINMKTTTRAYTVDDFYDSFVVRFDENQEIIWNRVIPKVQESFTRGMGGTHAFFGPAGSIYLLYNENPKNLDYSADRKIRNLGIMGNKLALVKIDKKGNVERQLLGNEYKDLKDLIFPGICMSLEDGSTILVSKKKNRVQRLVPLKIID